MSLIDVIGFLIGLAAVTFLFIQRIREERRRRRDPEAWQQKERKRQHDLKQLLKSMDIELEEEEEVEEEEQEEIRRPSKTSTAPPLRPLPPKELSSPPPTTYIPHHFKVIPLNALQEMFKDTNSITKAIIIREVLSDPRAIRPYEPFQ